MGVGRWEPFRELAAMQNELRRALGQVPGLEGRGEGERDSWVPPLDAWETERELVVALDVPGVAGDSLDVSVDEGTLVVRGERQRSAGEGERYYRLERRFGSFSRSSPLPQGIDEGRISAEHRDGVLEIHVPKPEQRQPRRIQVGGEGGGSASSG